MLNHKKIKEIDKFLTNIPKISTSASKILEISKKKDTSMIEIYNIVKHDPVLTGKVLRLINSSYYSLPCPIVSLVRALTMLGINTVKNMIISSIVIDTIFNNPKKQEDNSKSFLKHSISVATIAKMLFLKKEPESKKSEEYFVAGLLHDIGKFPFLFILNDEYNECYRKSLEENILMINIENKEFSFSHSDMGEKISNMWKLGHQLTNVIKYHHNIFEVPKEDEQLVAIVSLADMLSIRLNKGFMSNSYTDAEFEKCLELSEISYDFFLYVENNSEEIINKSEIFLQI